MVATSAAQEGYGEAADAWTEPAEQRVPPARQFGQLAASIPAIQFHGARVLSRVQPHPMGCSRQAWYSQRFVIGKEKREGDTVNLSGKENHLLTLSLRDSVSYSICTTSLPAFTFNGKAFYSTFYSSTSNRWFASDRVIDSLLQVCAAQYVVTSATRSVCHRRR